VKTRARFWSAGQPALVTVLLITINVAVFVYAVFRDTAALGSSITQTHVDLALYGPAVEQGDWYRLITSGFLHYGIIHLAFNMYLLYVLGQMLEPAIGRVRFLLVYMAGLLGGSAGALLLSPNSVSAGASGAVFGLLGLSFVGYYLNGVNPLTTGVGTLLLMNLGLTFLWSERISVGGHLGGAVAGSLCALAVMAPPHRRVPQWLTYALPLAVMIAAVTVAELSLG
jgi:membrane associated rhomboid family serine protease